nr:cyclic nucleotide-binding domain-containing protein [Phycisphaerae bacterium]NIR93322.1 cyclic nucleotide-binding domain-containing protein [Gammaproteobacteria bacterium]NIP51770.1 cyclic nucleotide-binding domain-containing protein [Phycisphaerae bacterium]NIU56152.1 cyclic nucleotide-binding domain-containing protein [Phycisphaerae bacterium]NIW92725.1 cyclic nucleotide-binding domain-containing protein [Phycisphaerae bacterium]
MQPQKYPAGSVIIQRGTPAEKFCLVTKGFVNVILTTPDDQEFTVERIGRGQYFGEVGLMRGGLSMATVCAAADCDVEVL